MTGTVFDIRSALAAQPRITLGHWPTPLERADRLRARIGGPELWFKRDDCSGLAFGGNKARKLEYLLGRALAEGADEVVTVGALQSNHASQTAAACARLGLPCHLILVRAVDRVDAAYTESGNVLLDRVLGATIHFVDDPGEVFERFVELQSEAEASGRTLFGIVPGGSDATGTLGYMSAAVELADQINEHGIDLGRIVVTAGTAGTAAGLILGMAAVGLDAVVDIACVYESAGGTEVALRSVMASTAEHLGIDVPPDSSWTLNDQVLGEGYGIPTAAGSAAIEQVARTEGVLLDPVYTGKTMAHLVARIERGELDPDGPAVVFVHTGGGPGLFAYGPNPTQA